MESLIAFQRSLYKQFGPVKIIGENGFRELIEMVQNQLQDGMKILDVGCGTGDVLLEIYKNTTKKVKIIGIDYSSSMIDISQQKAKKIKDICFLLMDSFKTNFRDNYFDIVVDRLGPKSYDEIYRVLKNNSLFFFS